MNLKERNDFCWAARHALMDLVMLEVYQVKDKVGVAQFIEHMPENKLMGVTLDCLNLVDGDHDVYMNDLYEQHLKNSRSDLPIQDSKVWIARDSVLMEAGESPKDISDKAIEIAKAGSLYAAVSYLATQAITKPSQTDRALKRLVRIYGVKAERLMRRYPSLRAIAKPGIQTVKGLDKAAQNPGKVIDNVKAGLKKAGKSGLKGAVVAAGVTAASLLAYGIYKRLTDPARKICSGRKGKDKTACILRYKIQAAGEAIKSLEKGMSGCDERPDPQKCKYSFQKKIWYWNKRKTRYQDELAKLAQNKSQFRTHKKLKG